MNKTQEVSNVNQVNLYEYLIYSALLIQVLEFIDMKDIGNLDSSNTNVKLRPKYLERLHQMIHVLFQSIKFKNKCFIEWIIIRQIKVKEMNFSFRKVDDSLFVKMNCPSLTKINLICCSQITNKSVIEIAKRCPLLTYINLSGRDSKITDKSIIEISKRCTLLNYINLGYCPQITDLSIFSISKRCPLLTNLNICGLKITDKSVLEVAKKCPLLQYINLSNCSKITDLSVIEIAKRCPSLTNINLDLCCSNITDKSVIEIAKNCPLLTNINLRECHITNTSVIELLNRCPLLTNKNIVIS